MRDTLKSSGYIPISLVYDGIYFGPPKGKDLATDFPSTNDDIEKKFGLRVRIKNLDGEEITISHYSKDKADFWPLLQSAGVETACVIADNPFPELRDLRIPISFANLGCAETFRISSAMGR